MQLDGASAVRREVAIAEGPGQPGTRIWERAFTQARATCERLFGN